MASRVRALRRRPLAWASLSLLVAVAAACGGGSGGAGPQFPVELTSQRVAAGERVYATNCAVCHGEVGSTPALAGAPSHAEDGHTWHHADRHLYQWILDRPPLAQVMPAFRGKLSDGEVVAVLAYIKSKWPADILSLQNENSRLVEQQLIEDAGL